MFLKVLVVGPLQTNCIIIAEEKTKKAAIVDPGADADKIYNEIIDNDFQVEYILLTHGHYDHIGAVEELKSRLNPTPKVVIHEDEEIYLKDPNKNLSAFRPQYIEKEISFDADILIKDSEHIKLGNIIIEGILLPGHTNSSVCYYIDEAKVLIAGDTLFYHSIGTSDSYEGPFGDLIVNIDKRLFTLDDEVVVYPGHARSTTIKEEREKNPYLSNSNTPDPWLS